SIPLHSQTPPTLPRPDPPPAISVRPPPPQPQHHALCSNVVPTHPGTERRNRRPTAGEVAASLPFLAELARGRRVVAVGRLAERVTGAPYVRHPSHGGGTAFRRGLLRFRPGGGL